MDAITTYPAQTRHKDLRRRPFIPYPGSAGTASRSVTAGGGDLRRVLPSVVSVSGFRDVVLRVGTSLTG